MGRLKVALSWKAWILVAVSALALAVAAFVVAYWALSFLIPSSRPVATLAQGGVWATDSATGRPPEALLLVIPSGESGSDRDRYVTYTDKAQIEAIHRRFQGLTARRVSDSVGNRLEATGRGLHLCYNDDKGRDILITEEGRVIVLVDGGEIRNRSRLTWLWWRLDKLRGRSTAVYYVTAPDSSVLEWARTVKAEALKSFTK